MNARIHGRYDYEERVLGKHIFGKGTQFLDKRKNEGKKLNRDLLINLANTHELRIMNTIFQKPAEKLITHRPPGTEHGPPWTPDRYATTDHMLVRQRWKNGVRNIDSLTNFAFPSDHYPVIMSYKQEMKVKEDREQRTEKFLPPAPNQKALFNKYFQDKLMSNTNAITTEDEETNEKPELKVTEALKEAAKNTLTKAPQNNINKNITKETIDLIEERQRARENNDWEKEKTLTYKIRKSIRKEKKLQLIERMETREWDDIKYQKKGFMPKFTK